MKTPANRRRQQAAPQNPALEPIVEALRLLQRQARIRDDLRGRRVSHILAERELLLIRNRLAQFQAAVQAITLTAAELHRPVDTLSVRDVETQGGLPRPVTRPSHTHAASSR